MIETKIKKYYLGELGEIEANDLEEELAVSAELTESAQIIEDELIYAYLQGGLSANERLHFEKNYLLTPARYEKLKSAQIFLKNVQAKPVEIIGAESKIPFWQKLLGSFSLSKALAFTALAVLLLGGVFVLWLNRQNKKEETVQITPTGSPTPIIADKTESPSPISENINQPNKNVAVKTPTPSTPTPTPTPKTTEPIKPTLATFTLFPGTLRSNGEQFLKITPNVGKINLNLSLPKDSAKYATYQATVKTADGETIFTTSNLKSLNLNLPADKLSNQTYIIFLEGKSPEKPAESIAEYTFRVRR
ncbi:MAG: hypothetical protein K1X72_23990 [Pyrinomonadaceae bacterium]|nr:hypothetical protein [Pyrinomonadaceae bacterium]